VLASFMLMPQDYAASLPMAVWTLPAAMTGFILLYWPFDIAFPFMPSAFGYYGWHLVYFFMSIVLIARAMWRIVGGKSC
jgi:hypothetical protein